MPSIALLAAFMCYTDIKKNRFIMTMKKLPNRGDLVGVTPHPSDPTQAFPHTSYPHWGILVWEGPLPNKSYLNMESLG